MSWFQTILLGERAIKIMLFALYVITAVRICRYSRWINEGAPNPFLPKSLQARLVDAEPRLAPLTV